MTDPVDTLLVEVRAETSGFAADVATMRGAVDGQLIDGFARAGTALERGLLSAIRRGSLGFEDLRNIAMNVLDQIASQALQSLFSPSGGSGGGLNLGNIFASLLGLPGRATGAPFRPGAAISSASAGPRCSCRPARAASKPAWRRTPPATCASP